MPRMSSLSIFPASSSTGTIDILFLEYITAIVDTGKFDYLKGLLSERILLLDGAMGSLLQCACGAQHDDKTEHKLADLYVKENPELIKDIHMRYLEAGADIIETDSFNSNPVSLSDYGLEDEAYNLSYNAASLAKEAVEEFMKNGGEGPRFVAGSVGPTKQMLTLAQTGDSLDFDRMAEAFAVQIRGLLDGGADIILLETVFDTLTVKSALYALSLIEEERGEKIPVIISGTFEASSGRLLSGQTIEAFYASVRHANPLAIGINCGFGSEHVLPYLRRLADVADTGVSVYPNAGLPDDCGEYHECPSDFVKNLLPALKDGLVNIVGGCCGTTPEHIRALKSEISRFAPRPIPEKRKKLVLSNLDFSDIGDSRELVQIGERTNVAGSAKFARLVREKNFDEALDIAAKQVRAGAGVIDVCMDDGMEDSAANMEVFLKRINEDSETGATPVMIDSSDWEVVRRGLKVCQGKSIVNSISLKEGERDFLEKAREIKRLGAAAVVMLFDEKGQAETYERKIEVAERAYRLLVEDGFDPSDIIFDPNVLTVGLEQDDRKAIDFIRAVEWIKQNLPQASVSGGISNLSFAFRGNNLLREAMHTVFLYHAGKAGLDMAIVNAGMLSIYDDIDPRLLELLEDLILCRKRDAVEPLIAYSSDMAGKAVKEEETSHESLSLEEKIGNALSKGKEKEMGELMLEALKKDSPLAIIENILMPAMKRVGTLFGEGKMFLPQVIKAAQAMKKAVLELTPFMDDNEDINSGKESIVIATVKGDVHDIGKNIVALVASCNGFEVADLGVRVEADEIVRKVKELSPKAVLLSGLISPSLNEMVKVCRELEMNGLDVPVIIGGAATSEIHTAVKIAPQYSGPVFYSPDAAVNLKILTSLSDSLIEEYRKRQHELRELYRESVESKNNGGKQNVKKSSIGEIKAVVPAEIKRVVINGLPLEEVEPFIDWNWLLASFGLGKRDADEMMKKQVLEDSKTLFGQIKREKSLGIEGVVEIFKARVSGDDIVVIKDDGTEQTLPMKRAESGVDAGNSVSDFLNPSEDYIALFAVSAGKGLKELENKFSEKGEVFNALASKLIADRLAEAGAQWVHNILAKEWWGFEAHGLEGVRIAFGYPSAPAHSLKRDAFRLLEVEKDTAMRLTETDMIVPSEAVCGMIMAHGRYINATDAF